MTLEELLNLVTTQLSAVANIEVCDPRFYGIDSLKLGPRHYYHHGSYCHFAKLNGNQEACHQHKRRTVTLARRGRSFHGCCPFGVWDYAEPVVFEERCVAVIYLGHFQGERVLATIHGQAYDGPALTSITDDILQRIRTQAGFIRQFILYAFEAARLRGQTQRKQYPAPHYHRICVQFIQNNYHQHIRLSDLAKLLEVNVNYLGQIIQRQTGRTFRQLLNDHRISQAKVHLSSEFLPVTKVAYICGFQDSNYFASVFREQTGMTPSQWRQLHGRA